MGERKREKEKPQSLPDCILWQKSLRYRGELEEKGFYGEHTVEACQRFDDEIQVLMVEFEEMFRVANDPMEKVSLVDWSLENHIKTMEANPQWYRKPDDQKQDRPWEMISNPNLEPLEDFS